MAIIHEAQVEEVRGRSAFTGPAGGSREHPELSAIADHADHRDTAIVQHVAAVERISSPRRVAQGLEAASVQELEPLFVEPPRR